MKVALYVVNSRRGYSVYLDGHPAADYQLKAIFSTFPEADAVYRRWARMMSHAKTMSIIFLIGEAATLAFAPTLALVNLGCYLGWVFVAKTKMVHAVHLYDRLLFERAGLPTQRLHHQIKIYYQTTFMVY
jgi:hypothetical protein